VLSSAKSTLVVTAKDRWTPSFLRPERSKATLILVQRLIRSRAAIRADAGHVMRV
jgi:hypothetical protein